eukprot:GFYU01000411.1.p1 GENE.GFYU01000411.1~~GFYU01000411.1.p1  ORF type:complete len:401 (+),score=135.56 GFYU01000411.1:84-1286(+)
MPMTNEYPQKPYDSKVEGTSGTVTAFGFKGSFSVMNFIFAAGMVIGQVGQNSALPIFTGGDLSPFFILMFASMAYVAIFGLWLLYLAVFTDQIGSTEWNFSHRKMFWVGFCDCLNGLMVVYASPPSRTAPYLQAILQTFMIPMVVGFRYLILRKTVNLQQTLCASAVLAGLFVTLTPKIFGLVKESEGSATGAAAFLWPMCFMLGFAPAAIMNVLQESQLKEESSENGKQVNLIWYLFFTSFYQFASAWALFWTDLLPEFGTSEDIKMFASNVRYGFECFFGSEVDCGSGDYAIPISGCVFISFYVLTYIASGLLLRHAEGATYMVIVQSLVTPLGLLFWTMFQAKPSFHYEVIYDVRTTCALAGLVLISPAVYFYNKLQNRSKEIEEMSVDKTPFIAYV